MPRFSANPSLLSRQGVEKYVVLVTSDLTKVHSVTPASPFMARSNWGGGGYREGRVGEGREKSGRRRRRNTF